MPVWREVSIVIPVAPAESAWRELLADLRGLPVETEILLVAAEGADGGAAEPFDTSAISNGRWITAPRGRANQLNAGAEAAGGRFLWFLHADSRLSARALAALEESLQAAPDALHYFNLEFLTDGPTLTRLNAAGAWFRSHFLKMPFGDQGFCLRRDTFFQLGGFDPRAPYGEDHLLVWAARRAGISLRCTGASLQTSARKYRDRGWCRTTLLHLWLTAKQALPQWWRLSAGPPDRAGGMSQREIHEQH